MIKNNLSRTIISAARRTIERPLTTIVLALVLFVNVQCVGHTWRSYSIFGDIVQTWINVLGKSIPNKGIESRLLVRADGIIHVGDDAIGESQFDYAPDDDVAYATFWYPISRDGLWSMTRERHSFRLRLTFRGQPWGDEDIARAHIAFAEAVVPRYPGHYIATYAHELRTGPRTEVRILWMGYLLNMFMLAVLAGLVWSLAWVPRIPARIRAKRLARSPMPLCARCGYSLQGLSDPVCPECGTRKNRPRRA